MNVNELIDEIGIKQGMNVIIHSSLRQIKKTIPHLNPIDLLNGFKEIISLNGSIIMPTFTYCFKKTFDNYNIFDRESSKSKVGSLTELFRVQEDTIRTSSPTHSFAMWGKVLKYFDATNSPTSPLGKGSILEWLANIDNSYVLLLGCDFHSLTFGHYLEIINEVPWSNISPWNHLGVLPIGVHKKGEQKLTELPGCSKSFINFQNYLINKNIISTKKIGHLDYFLIPINELLIHGTEYFTAQQDMLICPKGTCTPCDERRNKLNLFN